MQLLSIPTLLLLTKACLCFPGANLTSNLDRIKIVFTPMKCRRLCGGGGRCFNSCEKGDVTTVYSETSQQANSQGFRLCECPPVSSYLFSIPVSRGFSLVSLSRELNNMGHRGHAL